MMSETDTLIVRIVTLAAVLVALCVLHWAIWRRWTTVGRVGLLMAWLIALGLFLIDRIFNSMPGVSSPVPSDWVHAWSIFIRLLAASSVAAVSIIVVLYRRKQEQNE